MCAAASLLGVLIARFKLADKPDCDASLCVDQQSG
jgi:hypothetical protein